MRPGLEAVDALVAFPSLSADLAALKEKFPLYTAAAEDVDPSHDLLLLWKQHESTLPYWSQAARDILLILCLRASFLLTLQDHIEASLMLQYNKR